MIETNLEQRVILAVGWLRKAGRLSAPDASPGASELPEKIAQSPREYAQAQSVIARDAIEKLMRLVTQTREQAADSARIARYKRETLAVQAASGEKTALEANEEARRLAEQMNACRVEQELCERLMRLLRGQEEIPLPSLPLCKYAAALERLESTREQEETVPSETQTPADKQENPDAPVHVRACRAFLKKTDRSDRIALTIALVLCFVVVAAGLHYVYNWGSIDLEIIPLEAGRLRVVCVNSTGDSILLNVPYDGGPLAQEQVTHFGVLLELLDEKGQATRPVAPETLWEYKDSPTHLYGAIVIGPMFFAELSLDIGEDARDANATALRLTLFRAPRQKYKTYTFQLPEAVRESPE